MLLLLLEELGKIETIAVSKLSLIISMNKNSHNDVTTSTLLEAS